jgi:hypothetical protein
MDCFRQLFTSLPAADLLVGLFTPPAYPVEQGNNKSALYYDCKRKIWLHPCFTPTTPPDGNPIEHRHPALLRRLRTLPFAAMPI